MLAKVNTINIGVAYDFPSERFHITNLKLNYV